MADRNPSNVKLPPIAGEQNTKKRTKRNKQSDTSANLITTENVEKDIEPTADVSNTSMSSAPTKKKRKKKRPVKESETTEYINSGLAADIISIKSDIVIENDDFEITANKIQPSAAATMKSQPTTKLFIETGSGFKGENKTKLMKREATVEKMGDYEVDTRPYTTLDLALSIQGVMQYCTLFIHGLTAGIALWHIVIVYVLSYHSDVDFRAHYQPLAQPVQCLFYLLLALCTLSAMDRSDIGQMTWSFFIKAVTLQTGTIAILIYGIGLILSLSIVGLEDRIHLEPTYPYLWFSSFASGDELQIWRNMNTARGACAILGWIVLSVTPKYDRLSTNLKSEDSIIHGIDMNPDSKA